MQHVAKKDHWRRGLLIRRDTTFGFNSAQVAWLEGRIYDLLDAAGDARLHNGNRPSDETLPAHERLVLEASVAPIRRVLRLIGYDPSSPDAEPAAPGLAKKRSAWFFGIRANAVQRDSAGKASLMPRQATGSAQSPLPWECAVLHAVAWPARPRAYPAMAPICRVSTALHRPRRDTGRPPSAPVRPYRRRGLGRPTAGRASQS